MPGCRGYDAVIIGGGHSGLTCACGVAGGGRRAKVLERPSIADAGACRPGFRDSAASRTASLPHPKVTADQRLAQHGLRIVARPVGGRAGYRSPISRLYHCGAGAHPGGRVAELPGRDAARVVPHGLDARRRERANG
jgi:phytoene dehydrogenase-like protein